MAEEHRVGDDSEERGADDRACDRERCGPARGDSRGDETDDPDERGDEIEAGRELRAAVVRARTIVVVDRSVDAGHGGDPLGASIVLGAMTRHSRALAHHRDHERDRCRHDHADRRCLADRHGVEREPDRERADRQREEDAPQQPSVAEADLASAGRDPQPEQTADRPLQQDGGPVEADHGARLTGQPCLPLEGGYCPTLRPMPRARSLTSLASAAVALGSLVGLSACVPSDSRPTLGTAPVDSVSREADGNRRGRPGARPPRCGRRQDVHRFVCDQRKLGDLKRSATVVQSPPHTVVQIGDVALFTDAPQQTCDITKQTCEDGLLEQRISDVGISSRFYGPATAQQLRVAVGRESSPPTFDTTQVGNATAQCVHVPVGGGQETYCVNSDGLVALLDTAAEHIELTSYSPDAAASAFARPGQASTTTSS